MPLVSYAVVGRAKRLVLFAVLAVVGGCGQVQSDANAPASAALSEAQNRSVAAATFNTEQYDTLVENEFVEALLQPQSTFSIDVDTASYSNVRRMLVAGQLPPAGAVRIEELVNYFSYDYPEPKRAGHPFSVTAENAVCPWSPGHQLLRIGLKGKSIDFEERTRCNLVFLLDVSGSMMDDNKLPLVQSAMKLLVQNLNPDDRIAIVVYAGATGLALDSTAVFQSVKILEAIESLQAGGSTNGGAGIKLAYQVAAENFVEGGVNRVILGTDGDFNVGLNSSELITLIQEKARSHIELTVLGFGTGNLKDATMEELADRGNGNYAYIDSLGEAKKVLVQQVGGTLLTIAKDVKIQVDFNPTHVQAYRLLGYENRLLSNRDFQDDSKDAGEMGAGHMVTALYEIIPSDSALTEPQRPSEFVSFQISKDADVATKLTINLRYKLPGDEQGREFQVRVPEIALKSPSADFQFAAAVAAYGMLLRNSKFIAESQWDWVVETAEASVNQDGADDELNGIRAEFVRLAKTARRLSR